MAWTIDYADTAKGQLSKLDRQTARRIVNFMDERVVGLANPRSVGKALTGPLGALRVLVVQVDSRSKVYR